MKSQAKTFELPESLAGRKNEMFPVLTPQQISRIQPHGRVCPITAGEVLIEAGQQSYPFYVVLRGKVEVVQPKCENETQITIHEAGQFNGEVNLLSGRHAMSMARVIVGSPGTELEFAL